MEKGEEMTHVKRTERDLVNFLGKTHATREEIARALGYKDAHSIDWALVGLKRIAVGKRYLISEVAEKLDAGSEYK